MSPQDLQALWKDFGRLDPMDNDRTHPVRFLRLGWVPVLSRPPNPNRSQKLTFGAGAFIARLDKTHIHGHLVAGLLAVIILAGCAVVGEQPSGTTTPTRFPTITPTPTQLVPSPPGSVAVYAGLEVTAAGFELSGEYTNEYGILRAPPAGSQYLWAQVQVRNTTGEIASLPLPERFSVLYHEAEQKYSYGHRQGFADYTALKRQLPPEGNSQGWLRFELPAAARLDELIFAFTPEGAQVSLDVPDLGPWTEHPLFLWKLVP